jgi:hypothetical protein
VINFVYPTPIFAQSPPEATNQALKLAFGSGKAADIGLSRVADAGVRPTALRSPFPKDPSVGSSTPC